MYCIVEWCDIECICLSYNFLFPYAGKSAADSSQLSLQYMADRVRGAGGAIVVSPSGQWAATFTTERMAWAAVDHDVLWYGLDPNERFKQQLSQ